MTLLIIYLIAKIKKYFNNKNNKNLNLITERMEA